MGRFSYEGIRGNSWLDISQLNFASRFAHPNLKAIAPWGGFTDLYAHQVCRGASRTSRLQAWLSPDYQVLPASLHSVPDETFEAMKLQHLKLILYIQVLEKQKTSVQWFSRDQCSMNIGRKSKSILKRFVISLCISRPLARLICIAKAASRHSRLRRQLANGCEYT